MTGRRWMSDQQQRRAQGRDGDHTGLQNLSEAGPVRLLTDLLRSVPRAQPSCAHRPLAPTRKPTTGRLYPARLKEW
jgi:hypothetical protein